MDDVDDVVDTIDACADRHLQLTSIYSLSMWRRALLKFARINCMT